MRRHHQKDCKTAQYVKTVKVSIPPALRLVRHQQKSGPKKLRHTIHKKRFVVVLVTEEGTGR